VEDFFAPPDHDPLPMTLPKDGHASSGLLPLWGGPSLPVLRPYILPGGPHLDVSQLCTSLLPQLQ
jgi:hypothetical protein